MVECIVTKENPNPICYTLGQGQTVQFSDRNGFQGETTLDPGIISSLGGAPEDQGDATVFVADADSCYTSAVSNMWSGITMEARSFFQDAEKVAAFCGIRSSTKVYAEEIASVKRVRHAYATALSNAKEHALSYTSKIRYEDMPSLLAGTMHIPPDARLEYSANLAVSLMNEARLAAQGREPAISWLLSVMALRMIIDNGLDPLMVVTEEERNPDIPKELKENMTSALKDVMALGGRRLFGTADEELAYIDAWGKTAVAANILPLESLDQIDETKRDLALLRLQIETMPDFSRLPRLSSNPLTFATVR